MRLKTRLLPFIVVISLLHPAFAAVVLANSQVLLDTKNSASVEPKKDKYLKAEDVVSLAEISTAQSSSKVSKKTAEITALLQQNGIDVLSQENIIRLVSFVRAAKDKISKLLPGDSNVYIHPSPNGVPIPVQFYRNGHIYLHLKKRDPLWKKGGFKNFSRSIDYRHVTLYANLVMTISNKHDVQSYFSELRKMYAVREEANLIHYRDISTYVGFNEKVLKQKVAFQSELFAGDLNHLHQDWSQGPAMVKAALGATQALIDFHRYHYYHRDLKPGNFFVRRQAGASSLVLADFGLSQHPDDDNFCRGMGGTRGYIAPELCRNHYENGRPCSSWDEVVAADTFALGMTIYNIMVGKESLFKHHITAVNEVVMPRKNVQPAKPLTLHEALDNLDATYKQVLQQKPQEVVGDDRLRQEAYKLVLRTIAPDPRQRLSLEQLKAGLAGLL